MIAVCTGICCFFPHFSTGVAKTVAFGGITQPNLHMMRSTSRRKSIEAGGAGISIPGKQRAG